MMFYDSVRLENAEMLYEKTNDARIGYQLDSPLISDGADLL